MRLKDIKPGMLIRSKFNKEVWMVTANYGERLTAVRTQDVTNPFEWEVEPDPNVPPIIFVDVKP